MHKKILALIMLAATLITACGDDEPPPTKTNTPLTSLTKVSPTAPCGVAGELAGKFRYEDMEQLTQCVVTTVDGWINTVYGNMPHPTAYFFVPRNVRAQDVGCPINDKALQYCTYNKSVFLGQAALWVLYKDHGDAAPFLVAAHEVGHHFQTIRGLETGMTDIRQVPFENQADCIAGVFMGWARAQGMMDPRTDIVDLRKAFEAAAGAVADGLGRTHGTLNERIQSFNLGYISRASYPITACNTLVTAGPQLAPFN